jgi:hypothetical protein
MPNLPHNALSDYLEAHTLLETLHRKKARLMEQAGSPSSVGGEAERLIAMVDAGIHKAGALVVQYECEIEGGLQIVADQADSSRQLFLDVSRRILEFQALVAEYAADLSEAEKMRWASVVADYATLHAEWCAKLAPEECPPPIG